MTSIFLLLVALVVGIASQVKTGEVALGVTMLVAVAVLQISLSLSSPAASSAADGALAITWNDGR